MKSETLLVLAVHLLRYQNGLLNASEDVKLSIVACQARLAHALKLAEK